MNEKRLDISSYRLSIRTALLLVWLCGIGATAFAEKMDSAIQEAIYIFEMKGETSEAIKILEDASINGDEDDKEKAFFYLAKIQELSNNNASASFYYGQSLARTNEISKAYFLSERESATNKSPESLLRAPLALKSPIQKTFGVSPVFLLLRDGSICKIHDDRAEIIASAPPHGQVFDISKQGIWYQSPEKDSLIFKSFYANKQNASFPITDIIHFFIEGNKVAVQGSKQFLILNNKKIVVKINDKYNGCTPEGFFAPTNDFILNCTDNALHFVSSSDGSSKKSIAQFDIIKNVLIDKRLVFLVSGNYLYSYAPKQRSAPLWKVPVGTIESMFSFGDNIALLESSGKVSLINKATGLFQKSVQTEASAIYPLAKGTLGLFSDEGTIITVDTLLYPLWHFNFAKPIESTPIQTNGNLYLNFGDRKLASIAPHYYGKKALLSDMLAKQAADLVEREEWDELLPVLDSLFILEPGNAEGWFFKALYLEKKSKNDKEKQKAWSEAVRLSSSNPQVTKLILNRYSKAIGAKFVNILPISPKTRYPQFFSGKKNLFTIDPAADKLFCINPETGEIRYTKQLGAMDNSPVIENDENTLAVAFGYNLTLYDLNRDVPLVSIQLPGKAFKANITESAIYISTWNGFLLKIQRPDNKLAWSKKIFSVPFLHTKYNESIFVCNLEGDFTILNDNSGLTKDNASRKISGQVAHLLNIDSTIAIASGNKLNLFNSKNKDALPQQILMESSISSLQMVNEQGEKRILVGLSDQSILLYSEAGAPLWKYSGKSAIFPKPFVKNGMAWIDQGNEIIGISLKTGKKEQKFSTPGGAGTPFVLNNILFSASSKRLLYSFSL